MEKKKTKKHSGMFQKGNTAKADAAKKKRESKQVLDETEMKQQKLFNKYLDWIEDVWHSEEIKPADRIRIGTTIAEFVTPKVKVGLPSKKDTPQSKLDGLMGALKEGIEDKK